LSLRIAFGKPYSRNAASITARTRFCSIPGIAVSRSKYRLALSVIVSGSKRCPSPVRNHPL
jgi:hypothetical protein